MKKIAVIVLTAVVMASLSACKSSSDAEYGGGDVGQNPTLRHSDTENSVEEMNELDFLCAPNSDSACGTQNGYYYLTKDMVKLRDGNYASHLMYMDYASCREIYLCSTAGCKHDSLDCPAVYSCDAFSAYTTKLFVYKNNLYILSREPDDDGSMSSGDFSMGGDEQVESKPAVLYRANLDGTQREKIYTFDAALTLEDLVLGDANGIYVITKKVSVDTEDAVSYATSSERRLMFLDLDLLGLKEVCSMSSGDHISWQVIGCSRGSLVLCGTDYGRELSRDEIWDDDIYKSLYENSSDVYAALELSSGTWKEICRQPNNNFNSSYVMDGMLFLSSNDNQEIVSLDLDTGERKTICSLPQNQIMGKIGEDTLCCRDWNLSGDFTYYFVDVSTGAISHSMLVNQCNGWDLDFLAETQTDVLVIYDYDAVKGEDGSYEIKQYRYALISKEDLFAGKENYRKIEMMGTEQ